MLGCQIVKSKGVFEYNQKEKKCMLNKLLVKKISFNFKII